MSSATVEPVGRKANWSVKVSPAGSWCKAGYKYDLTTYFSSTRDRTGEIEIGLKSFGCIGLAIFGTGVMMAAFHWCGTTPAMRD